jgi:predicted O-methyltransferase YrrM
MPQTVLEFGVGYSTLVLADALAKNQRDFEALAPRPRLRNANAFKLFSVDANPHWIEVARARIPAVLAPRITISHSRVVAGTFNGRLCHYYEQLPNVVADFIYLDGPSPQDVEGSVNGLDFSIDERTVMAADLLLMEPSLLPGAFILVDGRVNNARFLQRNFQRPFRCHYDAAADITSFELDEPPLGRHSVNLRELLGRK